MQALRDKARELVGLAEGQLLEKEGLILALKRELTKVRGELAASRQQQHAVRSVKCQGCIYKLAAMKALDEEGAGKKADLIREGV
ncbi:hypothetical protein ES705_24338 [subsurface metagenome]